MAQRQRLPTGGAIAKAMDYSIKRCAALPRHIADGELRIDNSGVENLIRPIALGRKNWLFAGTTPTSTSSTCWSGCRRCLTAASESSYPIAGP